MIKINAATFRVQKYTPDRRDQCVPVDMCSSLPVLGQSLQLLSYCTGTVQAYTGRK